MGIEILGIIVSIIGIVMFALIVRMFALDRKGDKIYKEKQKKLGKQQLLFNIKSSQSRIIVEQENINKWLNSLMEEHQDEHRK